ncbi:MAG: DMT family transporter, partial [Alphaproteobacteria bacterium]|nr:DMT family transporter [Alphaproteobacteria bacterium]
MTQVITKNPLMAALFMIGWATSYVTSMSFNKFISPGTPTPVVVFYRILIAFIWLSPILMRHGGVSLFKTKVTHLHILRGILTALTTGCTYYTYRYLPLGLATAIGLSGPLFVSLMAVLILKERLTVKKVLCILSGYVGVLIIVNPKSITVDHQTFWAIAAAIAGNILISGH